MLIGSLLNNSETWTNILKTDLKSYLVLGQEHLILKYGMNGTILIPNV